MPREILLLEPNYKNKYPPVGLMKISTYHKMLGDNVRFYKGSMTAFFVNELVERCLFELETLLFKKIESDIQILIKKYIVSRRKTILAEILKSIDNFENVSEILVKYGIAYRKKLYLENQSWDRVYVTTLFTFYWKQTIETIEAAKFLVKDHNQLYVGGVMASLLPDEIEAATGIKPFKGILDRPGILDNNELVVDDLPLDYSILEEIDYVYPTGSAYFTFMTKGCTRKCAFCSVPILEPAYKPKVDTIDKFQEIKFRYGEQQNLLLMDNNVLASPQFFEIIDEIKAMGFTKGATFQEPNQYNIAIANLRQGINDTGYIRKSYNLLQKLAKRVTRKKEVYRKLTEILERYKLDKLTTITKRNLLDSYNELQPLYDQHRPLTKRLRYVDFNQGTDARYVTPELMEKMSEIPIRPLRIAFDYLGMEKQYTNAVRLAARYGIKELSNYLLYNFKDRPSELYRRMQINIELAQELNIEIFSFPMKYIPLFGEEAKDRRYIGKNWNKKFIRAVQSILNVTKGIVASGQSFFDLAFGKNVEEFEEILYMPETYIIYRGVFAENGLSNLWQAEFRALKNSELWPIAKEIIENNDFKTFKERTINPELLRFLTHYQVSSKDIGQEDKRLRDLRKQYRNLIKKDRFVNLTLTYDFE